MRVAVLIAAMVALWVQPAAAVTAVPGLYDRVTLQISGVLTGKDTVYNCPDGLNFDCYTEIDPYILPLHAVLEFDASAFADGSEVFDLINDPSPYSPVFQGTIRYLGDGLFDGTDAFFNDINSVRNCGSGPCIGRQAHAQARSFTVVALSGAVPEPTTWATMILGLFSVAWAMRKRWSGPRTWAVR